ncbi:MAG TPA: efflux RND transporter periplasmic adaptor subunit, partial [Polyangiaceae bacterium]|nr:efflux RND transporter periplasmic adaptor subunit [Polyangiaceae bacterium]
MLLLLLLLIGLMAAVAFAVQHLGSPFGTSANGSGSTPEPGHAEHAEHAEHEEEGEEGHVKLTPEALKNADIEVATAGPGDVNVTLSLPGEVSLNLDAVAHVTPRVAGTAREVLKRVGDTVKKGELLATMDSRDLAEAQREFLASKERLSLAEATFSRAEQLQKENISAEKDYLQAKQGLAEARIEQRSSAQKLQAIGGGGGGGGYALVAPFAGTIIERHVTVGEVLTETTRAFTIADLSTIWVNVTVYAKDLPLVAVGQIAEVRAEGIAEAAHGTIAFLGQVVGEQTRSANARVVLKEPGPAWRPGLFATAEVVVDRATSPVVIPDAAVQSVEAKDAVFI